jgi:DNA-binding IclR family transcriptional regulator
MPNYGIVRQWLADRPAWMSVERAEAVIVGAVAEVAAKMRARGNPARHMGAFKSAVAQALRAAEPARDLAAMRAEAAWEAAIERWWANGRVGPMPELNAYRSEAA